jgi:cytochrome P450
MSDVPAHVPSDLLFDFDMWNMPSHVVDPMAHWMTVRDRGAPPIFYTPRNGGHWIVHRFNETLEGYRDTDFFTNYPNGIPARRGGAAKLIPVEIDPPDHHKYRLILAPVFSPVAVKKLQGDIRVRVNALMDPFVAAGSCDFAEEIAGKLPTSIFVELMGLPLEELPHIMTMEHAFLRGPDEASREAGANAILEYLVRFIEKEAKASRDNVAGILLGARDEAGRPWSRDEIYNAAFLLYVAGLDTVTNMMGFIWRRLAEEQQARAHVAANVDGADALVDELMRLSSPAVNARRVRSDGTWRGVAMRAGDALLCAPMVANRDPSVFPDPDRIDWTRPNSRLHVSFGAGPHRCVGSHLARQEILITLQEWFRRIPDFVLAPDADLKPYLGNITGYASLPLIWAAGGRA